VATADTDLANIEADGRQVRLFFGVIAFLFSLGLAALLAVADMPLALWIAVFVPAWISALSLLQAHGST
jgi:hypothetical protein